MGSSRIGSELAGLTSRLSSVALGVIQDPVTRLQRLLLDILEFLG